MKTSFLLAFLILLISNTQLVSQEIISDITSEGNEQRHILQEYDETPYLVKISSLDSLYTYDLTNGDAKHLHTTYSLGAYADFYQHHTGRWLLYVRPDGAAAYDFVNDEFVIFPYEEGYSHFRWIVKDHGVMILNQSSSDFQDYTVLLMNQELEMLSTDDKFRGLRSVTNAHYVVEERIDNALIYTSLERESLDVIHHFEISIDQNRIYDMQHLLYMDKQGTEMWSYNFDTGEGQLLHTIDIDFTRQELNQTENHFVYNNYNQDTCYSIVLSKVSLSQKTFPGERLSDSDTKSIGNSIIYDIKGEYDSLYIYNFDLGTTKAHENNLSANSIIPIADRYILTRNYEHFLIYDVETESVHITDVEIPFSYRHKIQELHINDDILIDWGSDIESLHDLASLNITSTEFHNVDMIPIARRGLIEDTHFHAIGEDITVLNREHLYAIEENTVYQLDQYPIVKNSHQTHTKDLDGVFWAERNDTTLFFYKYFEGEKKFLVSITDNPMISLNSFRPLSFLDGNKNIYVRAQIGFETRRALINKETSEITFIDGTAFETISASLFSNDYFYYIEDAKLYGLTENGIKHIIDFQPSVFSAVNNSRKFNDQVFFTNDKGIYLIENLEATQVYEFLEEDPSISYFSTLGEYLIFTTFTHKLIYKEGQWLPLSLTQENNLFPFGEEYLKKTESTGTNAIYTSLYNIESGQIIELPDEINTRRLISIFEYNEEKYIISMDGSLPNYIVSVFKMTADFSEALEVKSFPTSGRGVNANFLPYGDEGLLYAGDKLFLMNDLLEFVPLGVTGDNTTTGMQEKNGIFYFIAKNAQKGRQVYSIVAFSRRVNVEDITWEEISIYPNPSQHHIQWDVENANIDRVQIYDQNGKLMIGKSNVSSGSIDISTLSMGMYRIKMIDTKNQKVKTGRFIKI